VQFVVIGGNEKQINNLQSRYKNVTFLGSQPYSDLPNNQQAADMLVIPSTATEKLSSLYTSPLKLFAHMSSGVPLLVSKVPSLEVIVSEPQVTFFEADNARSLVEGVKEIKRTYSEKSQKAKELQVVSKKYLWTERAQQIKNFIS
jgi:glycosyltransferase involved in cell wall biosynthesis